MKNEDQKHSHKPSNMNDLRELRISKRESQTKFWRRFGVSQSRGSRFELGLAIPPAVAILVRLYLEGKITDGDLQQARRRRPFPFQTERLGASPG